MYIYIYIYIYMYIYIYLNPQASDLPRSMHRQDCSFVSPEPRVSSPIATPERSQGHMTPVRWIWVLLLNIYIYIYIYIFEYLKSHSSSFSYQLKTCYRLMFFSQALGSNHRFLGSVARFRQSLGAGPRILISR